MVQFIAQKALRDFLQETEDAMKSDRVDAAFANCQTILASFPESLEAHRLLGEVYLAQGRLEEALHAFDWVLTNDPENVLAYCNRAAVSERMSDFDTTLDCYQQAYELSRGDGQIRQKFTELSARVGQQGFIFSRAGLARLYMRGNLLTQAMQEWEAVLAATPDRLDARTGLLEIYWREGSINHVEELATQILQNVPGCVKALLLLAHVTASKDIAQAQALLQQVEALDPDLMMAKELFADLFAHYPNDPFLMQLKKAPCMLDAAPVSDRASQSSVAALSTISAQREQAPMFEASAASAAGMLPWDSTQGWRKDAAFLAPFSDANSQQNASVPRAMDHAVHPEDNGANNGNGRRTITLGLDSNPAVQSSSDIMPTGSWTMQEESLPPVPAQEVQLEPWEMLQNALQNVPPTPSQEVQLEPWEMLQNALQNVPPTPSQEVQLEPWEMLQSALHAMPSTIPGQDQEHSESQRWEDQGVASNGDEDGDRWQSQDLNAFAEADLDSSNSWISSVDRYGAEETDGTSVAQENGPPSWLSMLTQADRKQMTADSPALKDTSPPSLQPEKISLSSLQEPVAEQSVTSLAPSPWSQELEATSPLGDDEDEFSFGPAWLRSLGAATLEKEAVPHLEEPTPAALSLSIEAQRQGQPTPTVSPVKKQERSAAPSSEQAEQDLVMTLEELEQQLLAKGFVAMEPNSLSTIAQAEEAKSANIGTSRSMQQASQPVQEMAQKSALAELGMMFREPVDQTEPVDSSAVSSADSLDFPAEPLWMRELRSSSISRSSASIANSAFNTPIVSRSVPPARVSQALSHTPPREETIRGLKFESPQLAGSSSVVSRQGGGSSGQNAGVNPLLESELETTMKRPAVRLQSMAHSGVPHSHASGAVKVSTGQQRESPVSENLDYKECLLKGYQHQLVGDYDEAMQGYRMVIRGAPELLGEVISNLRALLKLAPKYSLGYRVLGDAYMRQGEYLQAMDAYNSALTMAKKARD
jgi:tetratricopeptide (TPR) repeat protein